MSHLYDKRDNAISHEVKKGESLAAIALEHKGKNDVPDDLDWKEIALYNWATADKVEVVRALCERIGSAVADAVVEGAEPEELILDPAFGPSSPDAILVPKLWKPKDLEVNKLHTVTVRSRTPASAIGITRLDKWFIPAHETCEVDYRTQGNPDFAGAAAVTFEVYGSNYSELKSWKEDGFPELQLLPNVPVYADKADGGQIRDWYGLAKCDQGALSAPEGHPLNVAFSPYTVLLRYAKEGAHGDARIELKPFWVAFDKDGKPTEESCKIEWEIHNAKLKLGLLLIADRKGKIVFAKGLKEGDLDSKAYQWDGKTSKGEPVVSADMPYRVQLQAHTDIDTDTAEGLALAAMHTEVRLYVHEKTLPLDKDPYEPAEDSSSLDFSIADIYHADKKLDADADGTLWTKYKLAEAGFHPGPVTDGSATKRFKKALHEFQRSVPIGGGAGGKPYKRMTVEDDEAEAKKALDKLVESYKRPWFGKPAEPGENIGLDWRPGNWKTDEVNKGDFLDRLRDPKKRMIVWIDDRNWYTNGIYWNDGYYNGSELVPMAVLDQVHNAPEDLGGATADGRGSFEDRDARVDKDARDIARPWIPLQVDFRLLGKDQELDSEVGPHEGEIAEKVRAAIGPLRVDWTFDEIEKTDAVVDVKVATAAVDYPLPVLDHESNVLLSKFSHPNNTDVRGKYDRPKGSRTRMALRWVLDKLKKEHKREDVTRKSAYYNAPVNYGGIRPANAAEYFKAALGHGDKSLAPWTAAPDDTRQSICTAVHDRVGQDDEKVFAKRIGRAGVFFHPSRIAGDGFQIRGQVRFDAEGPYVLPNADVLRKRYALLPQAQTVQFRMWRKTTVRGYVPWAPWDAWANPGVSGFPHAPGTGPSQWRAHYTACHVSIENELGASDDELKCTPTSLFPNEDDYFDVVLGTLKGTDPRAGVPMTLSDDYSWPWSGHPHFGEPEPTLNSRSMDTATGALKGKLAGSFVTIAIRMSLALVQAIERDTGRMRGHVLVQHQTTPSCHFRSYLCPRGHSPVYIHDNDGAVMDGQTCPVPACGQVLAAAVKVLYRCGGGHSVPYVEASPGGGYTGKKCPGCVATLAQVKAAEDAHACADWKRGTKDVVGVYTPSCGFPAGVFWNVAGDANLWAHEIGHNRHYEHSADAQQKPVYSARPEHDNADNAFIVDISSTVKEKPQNKGWDRACLMSYVSYVKDQTGQTVTYDKDRDMPCFCFKCVLRNRGWKVTPLPTPDGDLQDVEGTDP